MALRGVEEILEYLLGSKNPERWADVESRPLAQNARNGPPGGLILAATLLTPVFSNDRDLHAKGAQD